MISQSVEGHFEYFDGGYLQISGVAKIDSMSCHSLQQNVEILGQETGGLCPKVTKYETTSSNISQSQSSQRIIRIG